MRQPLLLCFIAYSLFVLGLGVWSYRRKSLASFAVADREVGPLLGAGAFVGAFISAVTVIGVSGYASRYGWAAAAFTCYGYAVGWILLTVAARRMHRSRLTTVPEFLRVRFESPFLATFAAVTIVFLYSITLVVQLLGVAISLQSVLESALPVAILAVGAIFITYTLLGGLVAVIRTDMIEATFLAVGITIGAVAVIWKTGGTVITAPPEHLARFYGGNILGVTDFIGWVLVWGLGIPAQSYYLQRFYASRNESAARLQIAIGGIVIMALLLCVIINGVGAAMLIPPERTGDGAFPYLFNNVIGGWISLPILLAITVSVMSSTAGLLHIVGLFFALDVYRPIARIRDDASLLRASRRVTLIFGVLTTITAAYISTRPFPLISLIAGISWGGMASTLFVPLFFGLFWKRATRWGAIASSVGGLAFAIIGFALKQSGMLTFHEIYPGLIASFVLMVAVSLLSRSNTEHVIERFFPESVPAVVTAGNSDCETEAL